MTSFRRARRTVLAAAVAAAAFTAPAAAQAPPPQPASQGASQGPSQGASQVVRSGSPTSAVDRVADFYGAYIDAVYDAGRNRRLANDLRDFYLTRQLRERLATWEQRNHADGVLRAQNVPIAWAVKYDNSAAGHVFSYVRLTWSDGPQRTYTYLSVQSDLATKKISDIKQTGRPSAGTGTTHQQKPGEKPGNRPEGKPGDRPDYRPDNGQGNRPDYRPENGQGNRPDYRPENGQGNRPDYRPGNDRPMTG
jgi:hypothetical protein